MFVIINKKARMILLREEYLLGVDSPLIVELIQFCLVLYFRLLFKTVKSGT